MKVEFPSYTNDVLDTTYDINTNSKIPDVITIEINDDNHFKSLEDVKNYLEQWEYIKEIELIKEQIESSILNKKLPKFITENDNTDKHINMTYKSLPFHKQEEIIHKTNYDALIALRKTNFIKSYQFIKTNKDEIFLMLDNVLQEKYNKRKELWREASKKYYEKNKPNVEHNILTEEEKQEHKKLANKKHYEKLKEIKPKVERKVLTKEEKAERKKIANAKHYEKLKEQNS